MMKHLRDKRAYLRHWMELIRSPWKTLSTKETSEIARGEKASPPLMLGGGDEVEEAGKEAEEVDGSSFTSLETHEASVK